MYKILKTNLCAVRLLSVFGGGGWIRTTEVTDNRFTVCPLWPLGNSPKNPGACNPTRTDDLLIISELLYQLSYTSNLKGTSEIIANVV